MNFRLKCPISPLIQALEPDLDDIDDDPIIEEVDETAVVVSDVTEKSEGKEAPVIALATESDLKKAPAAGSELEDASSDKTGPRDVAKFLANTRNGASQAIETTLPGYFGLVSEQLTAALAVGSVPKALSISSIQRLNLRDCGLHATSVEAVLAALVNCGAGVTTLCLDGNVGIGDEGKTTLFLESESDANVTEFDNV